MSDEPPRHHGVLVVDKPAGMTSHDVVDAVREAAGQRKVGHTGTLDPAATGVLVVCLGRATRLVRFLQAGRKTYLATVTLGVTTTTQDTDGEVVEERDAGGVDAAAVRAALEGFRGDIEQVPPMVSAVRVDGERLHERARRGEVVEREPRPVTVHDFELRSFTPGSRAEAELHVVCSSGTYVRTLAHDLGRALGVGASLSGLRRTANGPFRLDDAHPLVEVRDRADRGRFAELVVDMGTATARTLPTVEVEDPDVVERLTNGGWLEPQGLDGPWAVVAPVGLVGVYRDRDGAGRPEAVLLRPDEVGSGGSGPA